MAGRGPGWVPNQHGAWAMLASPLLVGVLAGGPAWVHLPLTAFWFAGYLAFFATGLWLKSGRRARWWPPVRAYIPLATALGLVVLLADPGLLVWAPGFALPLGVGLWASARRRERDLLVGLTTVVGSSLMTVVAYAAGPGPGPDGDLGRAWLLALVQVLYFGGTVFYVKSAIRERGNVAFLRLSVVVHALATLAVLPLSWWLAGVFATLTARAAVVPPRGVSPKALGLGEVVGTVVVGVVSLLVT
ncbi:YwiC-like family protein [Nocardioides sp.]|uniref:YwiC-like family protein n=1 Tax=Nocardioides sp. TaxID=35761 RepID=UPI00352840D9